MDIQQILETINKFNEDIHDARAARMYHIEMDVAVENLNNIAIEELIEKELDKIDGIEVEYIEAQRSDFKESMEDTIDKITMDVPLLMRLLEFAREDAQTDLDLHFVAENAIRLSKEIPILGMDNYEALIEKTEAEKQVEDDKE